MRVPAYNSQFSNFIHHFNEDTGQVELGENHLSFYSYSNVGVLLSKSGQSTKNDKQVNIDKEILDI